MRHAVELSADTNTLDQMLTSLAELTERLPEFGEALLRLLDSGDEFVRLHDDSSPTPRAGEIVMRFYPSDRLGGLMSAFRARHPDLCRLEHFPLQIERADCSTPLAEAQ